MANPLSSLYVAPPVNYPKLNVSGSPVGAGNYNPQGGNPQTNTQTLPYGGGSYNPSVGGGAIAPAPIFTGAPAAPVASEDSFYDKYRDPKTGEIMSPEEYAIYLGNKIPKGTGEIPNYAGDALTNPNQSANELRARATNLNNARNDIATGTTDPYGVGNTSGIAYSPAELKAIENAYAGIYDPALNDVFSRLKDKEAADKEAADRKYDLETIVFRTNEAIRQWQATTGTKGNGTGGTTGYKFTKSQIANGAMNAGMNLKTFMAIEDDNIKNFFINAPNGLNFDENKVPMYQAFDSWLKAVDDGYAEIDEVTELITSSSLPASVKTYYIEQLPLEEEKKDGWLKRAWSRSSLNPKNL